MAGCAQAFDLKLDLKRHQRAHQAQSMRRMIQCLEPGCRNSFTRRDSYLMYLKNHGGQLRDGDLSLMYVLA